MTWRALAALLLISACAGDEGPTGFPDAGPAEGPTEDDDVIATPDAMPPPPTPDAMVERCLDEAEPNDDSPYYLGEFNDSDDSEEQFDGFNLHAEDDVDLFEVGLVDGFDFSNPTLDVSIETPGNDEYTIYASAICNGGVTESSVECKHGLPTPDGRGCESPPGFESPERVELTLDCGGWTDEGTAELRVAAVGPATTCEPYRMTVRVQ